MANENMKISQKGRDLIKEFEGLRLTAYQDSVGVWTIGYGHTKGVYSGMRITEQQANQFLDEDIKTHAYGIYNYVKVQLNQNQFDALASFHFNLGPYILSGTTLLNHLNSSRWSDAANEMKKYVNAGSQVLPGLVRRREAEAKLFLEASSKVMVLDMECIIWIHGKSTGYYFNGAKYKQIPTMTHVDILHQMHRDIKGSPMPEIILNQEQLNLLGQLGV